MCNKCVKDEDEDGMAVRLIVALLVTVVVFTFGGWALDALLGWGLWSAILGWGIGILTIGLGTLALVGSWSYVYKGTGHYKHNHQG